MFDWYTRACILLCLLLGLNYQCYAQSCATPIVVDFSTQSAASVTINAARSGNCCGGLNCISFLVKVNPFTDVINFDVDQVVGSGFYTINCGSLIPIGTPACISGLSTIQISYCKPGSNAVNYTITALQGTTTSGNLNLRENCTGTMSVTGFQPSSITWTSISPGAAGAYNSYLSQTSGVASVNVTPQVGAPAYIDYKVSGTRAQSSPCSMTASDTIRVYTFPSLNATITPTNPLICSGAPVTLTANPTGGKPAYSYLWSNGATTASISVNTAGTYSVSVKDQITGCGAITAQTTVTAPQPVTPTASSTSICTGNTAILTATAPGGPYQWYDAAANGNMLSTNSSYTTPVLTAATTYYVQTANSGCTSTRTPVTVTVNSQPSKPGISSF